MMEELCISYHSVIGKTYNLWGNNNPSSYHPGIDYIPTTAHPQLIYSSLIAHIIPPIKTSYIDSVDEALHLTRPAGVCERGLTCHWDWKSVLPSTHPPSSWRSPLAESQWPARTLCPWSAQWVYLHRRPRTSRPYTNSVPRLHPTRPSASPSHCVVENKREFKMT